MATKAPSKKAAKTTVATPAVLQFNDIEAGELFSEVSHYKVTGTNPASNTVILTQLATGQPVELSFDYVRDMLKPADHFFKEEKVGKEDKLWTQKQIDDAKANGDLQANSTVRVGDVRVRGIRTIFEEIYSTQVFTVVYETQPKERTEKEFQALRQTQREEVAALIEKARSAKKGMADALLNNLQVIQDNPITKIIPGTETTLRGYKDQFSSRDGKYNCVNVDITDGYNIRPVNINTIKELCFNGVKYTVE